MRPEVEAKVQGFPSEPGIYIFTDARGGALYVGKAANLRARVRAYLKPGGDGRPLLRFVEHEAHDVEFVVVSTEQEALLLENTVIKKRKPRYNVKLKDDKSFLMLRLDRKEAWPWFRLVRRRRDDGAEYFGPYASAKSVRRTLRLLHKVVPLRDCKDGFFHNRSRPCLKHEIGRCPAPCVEPVARGDYDRLLDEATMILRGEVRPLLRRLRAEMDAAASALEFERAQAAKTQIDALEAVAERQSVIGEAGGDQDAWGLHPHEGGRSVIVVLMVRGGRLESSRRFEVSSALPEELLLGDALARFYAGDRYVPREVLLSTEIADAELLMDWLSDKRGASVTISVPRRGARRRHVELAVDNARLSEADARGGRDAAIALAERIGLDEPPERIHCLDVSTIQGRFTVASRVCFVGGRPHKDAYRRFRIGEAAAGDDFASMDEAVRRSLRLCANDDGDDFPDLLIVDGGRGQLTSARAAATELGLGEEVALLGLAKSRLRGVGDRRRPTDERLFLPGRADPVPLPPGEADTLLVKAIRDEAHRFAISYHRQLRGHVGSELDAIPGVGPSRRRLLLRHFGSLTGIREAALDDLRGVAGLPNAVAEAVFEHFGQGGKTEDPRGTTGDS